MLNTSQMQRLAELNLRLHNTKIDIQKITDICEQLSHDNCTMQLSVAMHNQTQHDINAQKREVEPILVNDLQQLAGILIQQPGNVHPQHEQQSKNQKPCKHFAQFEFKETSALRILDAVLQEKKQLLDQIHNEMLALIKEGFNVEIQPLQHESI